MICRMVAGSAVLQCRLGTLQDGSAARSHGRWRQREHLKKMAIKGDQVFFDEPVSGHRGSRRG